MSLYIVNTEYLEYARTSLMSIIIWYYRQLVLWNKCNYHELQEKYLNYTK